MLVELIESRPAMVEKFFSSGVATEDAMVSGLPPGSPAETLIVGNSTCGSAATGRNLNATLQMSVTPMVARPIGC